VHFPKGRDAKNTKAGPSGEFPGKNLREFQLDWNSWKKKKMRTWQEEERPAEK